MDFNIQNKRTKEKAIHRFCLFVVITAIPYLFIYSYLKAFILTGFIGLIIILFSLFIYLNKNGHTKLTRSLIFHTTNFGLVFFSCYLGFNSGIYLYFLASPLLVYILFDVEKKQIILLNLFGYTSSFVLIYFNQVEQILKPIPLSNDAIEIIYRVNFLTVLGICFLFVYHFALNNKRQISFLKEQQVKLEEEIIEKNNSQFELRKSLKERELLLSEIHHRVKNNLAVICSLLELQSNYINNNNLKTILKTSTNRIKSIALLHEKLYENNVFGNINLKSYLNELISHIKNSQDTSFCDIEFKIEIDQIYIQLEESMPVSLILNELITNSLKHAFQEQKNGIILIKATQSNGEIHLIYSDNGVGDFDPNEVQAKLGLSLIEALATQLNATLTIKKGKGFNLDMIFRLEN